MSLTLGPPKAGLEGQSPSGAFGALCVTSIGICMGRSNSFATRGVLVEVQEFGSATTKEDLTKEFRIVGHTGQLVVRKL